MEISSPSIKEFTVYTKKECKYCEKVKKLLIDNNFFFTVIPCDDYLLENKEEFLHIMEKNIGQVYKTFPMVFYEGNFLGGFIETEIFINKLKSFDDIF
jgi:glutaredoxin